MNKRQERIQFILRADYPTYIKHKKNLKILLNKEPPICQQGDSINVDYKIFIEYLGGVNQRLSALRSILNEPGGVVEIDTKELKHGNCLIQEILNKIQDIQQVEQRGVQNE